MALLSLLLPVLSIRLAQSKSTRTQPNILFLLIDDLGWNDLSLHGGCDYSTPHLDALAQNGLELTNYYTQHSCTPTRHALMSGRYPFRDGMQQSNIGMSQAYGTPLELTLLPEILKSAGYHTHMLGKWHLGFCKSEYTPTQRGFESHLGFWGMAEHYHSKKVSQSSLGFSGIDFRDDMEPDADTRYSTYIYRNETLRILKEYVANDHEDPEPFFLYFASQAVHGPWNSPHELVEFYNESIRSENRQKLASVTNILDDTIGDIVKFMKSKEGGTLWNDTLFIISSDNGGPVSEGASNFPLRGSKETLWEGGIRSVAFVTGGYLDDSRRGMSMNALMHVSDWFPTLCSLAGVDYEYDGDGNRIQQIDGLDQRDNILYGENDTYSPREEIVHNVLWLMNNESTLSGAVRWRKWKIVVGSEVDSNSSYQSMWTSPEGDELEVESMSIQCSENGNWEYPTVDMESDCPFNGHACLFDIEADPCEYTDLRKSRRSVYKKMLKKLRKYNASQSLPTLFGLHGVDSRSDPDLFGGFWSPWLDSNETEAETETDSETTEDEETMMFAEMGIGVHVSNGTVLVSMIGIVMILMVKMAFDWWRERYGYKAIESKDVVAI